MATYITEIGRLNQEKQKLWNKFLNMNPTLNMINAVRQWKDVAVLVKELELLDNGY